VYTVPIEGGTPRRITALGPSYLHGWSPDGRFLVYTGERNDEFDVYRISADGGEETRLTTTPGLDDGPEYSPDGQYIYFNSVRSGTMQIWRMRADGSAQEQVTSDQYNNWFPHVSPNGQWIAFLSFMQDVAPSDHPFYKPVYLRVISAREGGGIARVVAYVYGGQGTINVPVLVARQPAAGVRQQYGFTPFALMASCRTSCTSTPKLAIAPSASCLALGQSPPGS